MAVDELLAGDTTFPVAIAAMEKLDAEGTLILRWGLLTALNEQVRLAAERGTSGAVLDRIVAIVKLLRQLPWTD